MPATIDAIEYALPKHTETARDLVECFPHWSEASLVQKTGIRTRHLAAEDECASDLGVAAANALLTQHEIDPKTIDFLIFCTQTPDYLVPTTACLIQQRLGLPTHAGALDINLGCSGYIYAIGMAKGLIETGQANRLLLVTGETYSKLVNPGDRAVRALFSDAGTATLIGHHGDTDVPAMGPFIYGTDGNGAQDMLVPSSAMRQPPATTPVEEYTDHRGNTRSAHDIYMNGRAVVEFTLREIPRAVHALCEKAGIDLDEVDAVVPHQASKLVLDGVRDKLGLSPERFLVDMEDIGNTTSSTIPIVLNRAARSRRIKPGALLLLIGFGVGLSWGATLVRLPQSFGSWSHTGA